MNQNKQSQLYSAEALRLNSHKTMRKLFLAVFAFFMTATLTFLITQNMKNTNAASFQAGNIMSDAVMGNYNSMSEADIQNFLKSKNSCNKYSSSAGDYSEVYGSKTYTWHVRNHRYVCMADDTFNGESAAHIIYTVAHEYRINPQVLIVLLQKEQGLITDQFPNSWQYNKAAGFGCPDTAPCDAQYYGLRTQLSKAANLFRTVLDGGWSNYPVGNNYVQYHPNQACGGSVINIENRATSALYRYTPYQPNGALLCGGSDGCSSYGNYNFYKYFTDWFGDTHAIQDVKVSSVYLPNDTFILETNAGTTIGFNGTANATPAIIANKNPSDASQQFTLERDGNYYRLKNIASNRYLDLSGANTINTTTIQLYDRNDTCAQKWAIEIVGDKAYRISSACSYNGKNVMDVDGGRTSAIGTKVQIYDSNNTDAQKILLTNITTPIVSNNNYTITNPGGTALALQSEKTNNATKLVSGILHNATTEQFEVSRDNSGYYYLKNQAANKNIDVNGANIQNTTPVQLYDANTTCAQRWIIESADGGYRLKNACSNRALDVDGGRIYQDGTKIQIYDSNNTKAQTWNFNNPKPASISNGVYTIKSAISNNLAIDLAGNRLANTNNIQTWTSNKTEAQKFSIEKNKNNYYTIKRINSNSALDVNGASTRPAANVQIYSFNNTCAQQWIITPVDNGQYNILNVCSRLALDVAGGSSVPGTNIHVYTYNNTPAQRWTLHKI